MFWYILLIIVIIFYLKIYNKWKTFTFQPLRLTWLSLFTGFESVATFSPEDPSPVHQVKSSCFTQRYWFPPSLLWPRKTEIHTLFSLFWGLLLNSQLELIFVIINFASLWQTNERKKAIVLGKELILAHGFRDFSNSGYLAPWLLRSRWGTIS